MASPVSNARARRLFSRIDTWTGCVYNKVVGYMGLPLYAKALLFCEIYSHLLASPRAACAAATGFAYQNAQARFVWVYEHGFAYAPRPCARAG